MKKEINQYIHEYVFSDDAKHIIAASDVINKKGFGLWSFKKLIFLDYYISPFLTILQSHGFTCYFLDLFSSSGANTIRDTRCQTIGSPIISILKGVVPIKSKKINYRFNKWFFIDLDSSFCEALRKRINIVTNIINTKYAENITLDKDIHVLCGDCNIKINEVIAEINKDTKEKKAVLAFIDPYNFTNIEWNTWKALLSLKYVDVIFTFPVNTLKRGFTQCKNLEKYLPETLLKQIPKNKIYTKIDDSEFSAAYAEEIKILVNRSITCYTKGISVKNSRNGEMYRIDLFTHCKPALQLTLPMATKLDKLSVSNLNAFFQQAQGTLKSLSTT